MKRILAILLCCVMVFSLSAASALELSWDDYDYWFDVMAYLVDEIGMRKVGRPGEYAAYEYLRDLFVEYGYSYEDGTLYETYSRPSIKYDTDSISLVAIKPAKSPNPQILTVCAHYDSILAGARDNASGTAAVMLLAKIFAEYEPFENTELRFIAFSGEEYGHWGSLGYCVELTQDELDRSIGAFNVDIITVDVWEPLAFSLDCMGMRTPDGYVTGTSSQPAYNRTVLAMLQAMEELGVYPMEDEDVTWCLPRHMNDSDHETFHLFRVDSVNVCFHGTRADGGRWPEFMHSESDIIGDFDSDATMNALNALYTAVDGLAHDHTYGDQITEYPVP